MPDKTRFTDEFAAELQRKARALCKIDVIDVVVWRPESSDVTSDKLVTRRMVNKAPPLNNFLSEIQGDVDLTRIYAPDRELKRIVYTLDAHWREGMIHVVSYSKNVITTRRS